MGDNFMAILISGTLLESWYTPGWNGSTKHIVTWVMSPLILIIKINWRPKLSLMWHALPLYQSLFALAFHDLIKCLKVWPTQSWSLWFMVIVSHVPKDSFIPFDSLCGIVPVNFFCALFFIQTPGSEKQPPAYSLFHICKQNQQNLSWNSSRFISCSC